MVSIDLLQELKLTDYYPQKLSFSEAIKLRGKSPNGCEEQYGLEIVRKLLMFDSTAVFSVTTEINKHVNNRVKKEADNMVQCTSDGVKQQKTKDKKEQSRRKLHPMDLLVVVMNCCDDFLRQILVEKMFANKLSISIVLPGVNNGSYTLLHFALRSLVPEVQEPIHERSSSLTDTLVDIRKPVVSFIRVGELHRSKSKLVNELLNYNSFNTFFHRDCANGYASRLVSIGSIEAAWFQSSTASEEEFNCRFFMALNLRGDAKDYQKQAQFLCQSSTLVVFMVDSFELFKEFYESVIKDVDLSHTKFIVCYISPEFIDEDEENDLQLWEYQSGVIFEVIYDWNDGEKMNDVDFTNHLRKTISKFFKHDKRNSNQMRTYANISRSALNFGFLGDENKFDYKEVKASADEFVHLLSEQLSDCKPFILPLQGEPWKKIGKIEREQRGKLPDNKQDETFIAEKELEKTHQRELQCLSLIQQSKITMQFSLKFHFLQGPNLSYYLNCCRIKLDVRCRDVTSNLIEEFKKKKLGHHPQNSKEEDCKAELSQIELKTANSVIGLEHILREHGQMYEAVISEEIRMKEKLRKAHLSPEVVNSFPTIVAKLLLLGHPLELMDGDTSNVPITWVKAVLQQVTSMTSNARIFVIAIIGVQSSGKSTLLNALFGLQFPVSAGRCTKGIYCHLVPVDKESLHVDYDYVLVVDTEGLAASEFAGNSTFRDNELATFAIGLADAAIINMKGENWAEMKDILQIAAYGLIRVRKTKAELELMPICMFVHQNVPAVDAENRNRLGQEKQFLLLDEAIEAAGRAEGFPEITKFDQVIKYDPVLNSWYFPDLWNGRPPKARISQDYIAKTKELRQYLVQLMRTNLSRLTISSFFLRMSDLWNAMLHNDFVRCYRNTQEIMSGMVLNDIISHEVDNFKSLNKLEQTKIGTSNCFMKCAIEVRAEKARILIEATDAVKKNFTKLNGTVQGVIDAADICSALKQKYSNSLDIIKSRELERIIDETTKDINVHVKTLENDDSVKDLNAKLTALEKHIQEVEIGKLNERVVKDFEEQWQHLIQENKDLVDEKTQLADNTIKETIRRSMKILSEEGKIHFNIDELFNSDLAFAMPEVTENDIDQTEKTNLLPSWVIDFVYSKSHVYNAKSRLQDARKKWELKFQSQSDPEFNASNLDGILSEVRQLLGILKKGHDVSTETDEMCSVLPPGYSFTHDYITRFIEFVCHYTYKRSLENSKRSISLTDPLVDIEERHERSISQLHYIVNVTAEENIKVVSKQIFDYAETSFVKDLGELIKEDDSNPTFRSKRAFLRAILKDIGQKTYNLILDIETKKTCLEEYMLYFELAESEASVNLFLDAIIKLLKDRLTNGSESETLFQKMVRNSVGKFVTEAKNALRQAETNYNESESEYIQIFKKCMNIASGIYFRINILNGFTEGVIKEIDNLYAEFLSKANSTFETFVCKQNKAAIRPLFEKIMGCREKCPFCSAPCSQSLDGHAGDHRANHYPTGIIGTIDIWGLFANTQETADASEIRHRRRRKLSLGTCQTLVGTRVDFRNKALIEKYNKWYHRLFNLDCHSFKNYRELAEYKNWDIPRSQNYNASLYGKWFMAQFVEQLAERYDALPPKIPKAWQHITWEEAHQSLDEPYFDTTFSVEERSWQDPELEFTFSSTLNLTE